MADIIKVKPKKGYQWNQDQKFIYIRIPMPSQVSLKKVDIFLSDLILRITSLQKKSTHFLDLYKQIDYKSSQSKFTLTDGQIHATLKKFHTNQNWQKLLIDDISLSDLKSRRRQSQSRYEQNIKQIQQNKQKLKIDYDRKATQQLMRFQSQERQKLQNKKKEEKDQAIKEIFSGVDQRTGKIEGLRQGDKEKENKYTSANYNNTVEYQEKKWREKEQLALKLIQQEQQKQKADLKKQRKIQNQQKIVQKVQKQISNISTQRASTAASKSIFTEQDVQSYNQMRQDVGQLQYEQIPVRKSNNVTVKFTQRIFPHLAARDTYVKEPPMPKNKANKSTANGDVQTKNPLWLKDKGDQFLKDKNFISAIQAYTQAISLDNKMIPAYANRSLCHLKQFNFINVISDCQQCMNLMKGQLSSQEDNEKSFNFMIKIQIRRAIALGWKGELLHAKTQLSQILKNNQQQLSSQMKQQINKSIYLITQRQQSISYKLKGDQQVKLGNYEKAIINYDQSISVDKNEYSISNKSLCLNKIKSFTKSIQVINQGIEKISIFNLNMNHTKNTKEYISLAENKKPLTILLKLYFRKAKALEQLDKIKQAEETLYKGLAIDSSDKDFQHLLKQINIKKNKVIIKQQKQKAANLIKQGKHDQALKVYQKCLKLFQSNDDLHQYLSILQNQCVCYLKSNDYQSIISTAIRILKIINTAQSKIVEFGDKKTINLTVEEMNKISVRTLMRRANAYLKKGQVYNAKSDLEKALEINPKDEVVGKQLEKIKQEIGV